MKIKLPIFFYNDETEALDKVGLDHDIEKNDIKTIIFYRIDAIAAYLEDGHKYSRIYASGNTFICSKPVEEVEKMIDKIMVCESVIF